MVTSYNNQVCKQAEIYYYDYISKENIEQIPEIKPFFVKDIDYD